MFAHRGFDEDQDAFDDHHRRRLEMPTFRGAGVGHEIIDRDIDGNAAAQLLEVGSE